MDSFRIFMLVACISLFLIIEATLADFFAAQDICEEKLGKVTPDMDEKARVQRLKCLFACEMKELGTMTKDGAYDPSPVAKQIGEPGSNSYSYWARFFPSVRECGYESRADDHCETAANFYDCLETIQTAYPWETKMIIQKFMFLHEVK